MSEYNKNIKLCHKLAIQMSVIVVRFYEPVLITGFSYTVSDVTLSDNYSLGMIT
jgi:hypothetical protein